MKKALKPIHEDTLTVQKTRARLAVVNLFHDAYLRAHNDYGLTKKEFAERIGMKPSHFSRILSGSQNVTVETAEAVLRTLEHRLVLGASPLKSLETLETNRYCRNGDVSVTYTSSGSVRPHKKYALSKETAE